MATQHHITLTTAACQALQSCSDHPFDGVIDVKGGKSMAVSEETLERLEGVRFPGETLSDTVLRVCTFMQQHGKMN